jgi:1,4-alpha-glucan branching enzyme
MASRMKRLLALAVVAFTSVQAQDAASPNSAKSDGRIAFGVRAPNAKEVTLRGQWSKEPIALARNNEGIWSATLEAVPAGVWEYSFSVDGLNILDSTNPSFKPQRQPGKSILHVPSNPPAPWDWQDVPHGSIHTHGYASKALGRPREIVVYTPPGYERDAEKKYPLLVLQHGSG